MASLLEGQIASIAYSALKGIFLDATLYRDVNTTGGPAYEPTNTITTASYSCKAIEDQYKSGDFGNDLVNATDVRLLVLANSLAVTPQPLDRITIRGKTYSIVSDDRKMPPVQTDPARATWILRCSGQ